MQINTKVKLHKLKQGMGYFFLFKDLFAIILFVEEKFLGYPFG